MKRPNNILCACLLAITVSAGASNLPPDWQHEQQFTVSKPGLMKISLPAETLNAARPGLEDLRLYDDAGNEIPYVIERPMPSPKVVQTAKSFSVSLNPANTVITLESGVAQPFDVVTLETPAPNFIKSVRVEDSTDGIRWAQLAQGRPIFRQRSGVANLKIAFPPTVSKWLRLTVDDSRSAPIPFTSAQFHAISGGSAPAETVAATVSERDESPGQTRLAINLGAANLDVAGVEIETAEPLFMRQVSIAIPQISDGVIHEQQIGQGSVYRVAVEGQKPSENLYVPLESPVPSRELVLLVENGDSPPLPVSSVQVERRPAYLVFLARDLGIFHLLTGNKHCDTPHYDLAALNMNLIFLAVSPVNISAVADNPNFHTPEEYWEYTGARMDISAWKFRKAVKISDSGAQQIELDPDVLAHANPDFADLRLMHGSNQVPYIIENTSIERPIAPAVTTTNVAKEPRMSRWLLQLPQARLPITRLSCVATTPLFQRDLRLYEMVADDRGQKFENGLGEANWTQTPDSKSKEFDLALNQSPQTTSLVFDTDNGDNTPLQLEQFKFFYRATRILFKAAPGEELSLCYGNANAAPPRYDLSLVAGQLLAADKNVASLTDEEPLQQSSWHATGITGNASYLFRGVLALVVAVLLVVISRLLPKTTSPPPS
jgi:Protein of unknown function (DUF3999)